MGIVAPLPEQRTETNRNGQKLTKWKGWDKKDEKGQTRTKTHSNGKKLPEMGRNGQKQTTKKKNKRKRKIIQNGTETAKRR